MALHPTPWRLRPLQRAAVAASAAVGSLINPERAARQLKALHKTMLQDPVGRQLLQDKPRLTRCGSDAPDRLRSLPPATFGNAYITWMDSYGFTTDTRVQDVLFMDDPELAYVMQRYKEVHDYWHVLCGVPPSVLGELALKWFELVQTGLPSCALAAFVGPLRLTCAERAALVRTYIPWAVHAAPKAVCLLTVRYEQLLDEDLADVRWQLRIEPAPEVAASRP